MNRSKIKGTRWESEIVRWLQEQLPNVNPVRRALSGALDRGDIAGVSPRLTIEAKAVATWRPGEWLAEVERERTNAGAEVGVVWIKRRGATSASAGFILLSPDTLLHLLDQAGYLR